MQKPNKDTEKVPAADETPAQKDLFAVDEERERDTKKGVPSTTQNFRNPTWVT